MSIFTATREELNLIMKQTAQEAYELGRKDEREMLRKQLKKYIIPLESFAEALDE